MLLIGYVNPCFGFGRKPELFRPLLLRAVVTNYVLCIQPGKERDVFSIGKCEAGTFYPQAPADLQTECIVEITPQQLIVKYMNDGELVEYIGEVEGEGHYLIRGKGFEASGTLHLADGRLLEGSWKAVGRKASNTGWRIFLETED